MGVSQNRVLGTVYAPEGKEMARRRMKLHKEALHNFVLFIRYY
jgi:hypothetical protein